MQLLSFGEIMIDRKAPVRLPRRKRANGRADVVRQARQAWRRNKWKQAGRRFAEATLGNDVAWPLLSWCRRATANRGDEALRHEDRLRCRERQKAAEIPVDFRNRRHGHRSGIFLIQPEPVRAYVEERLLLSVVQLRNHNRSAKRKSVVILVNRRSGLLGAIRVETRIRASGVEHGIPQHFECIPVQDIRA